MTKKAEESPYPNHIKDVIKQKGYTIQVVADAVGIPRRTITDYTTGRRPVPRDSLRKLARHLKCSIHELIAEPVHSSLSLERHESRETPLVRDDTALLMLEPGSYEMDTLRRQMLQQVLGTTGLIVTAPMYDMLRAVETALDSPSQKQDRTMSSAEREEFLIQCAASVTACWYLMRGNQLAIIEQVLSTYLPSLHSLVQQSSHRKVAASLLTQVYRLYGILALHKKDLNVREIYCQKSVYYGGIAEDANLQAIAFVSWANNFSYVQNPARAIEMCQKALIHEGNIAPLVLSKLHSELSLVYAQQKQEQKALRSLVLAQEIYPENPENDPSFLYADFSSSSLILKDGLANLALAQHFREDANTYALQAQKVFSLVESGQAKGVTSERIRVEIINHQAKASLALSERDAFCHYLAMGIQGAKELGSQKRREEAINVYKEGREKWPDEPMVKDLADLFL